MALDLSTLRRPANPQVVDPSTGRMREDWQLYFDQLTARINASVGALSTDPAPADAQYIVAATDGTLSAERVATNTATVEWDFATAGQAKASVPANTFGDVVGPASATDTAVALFDGTTGKLLQNSAITVDANGNVTIDGDNRVLTLVGPANVGIELGNVDGTGGLTFVDLHTGTTPTDYDVRLLASGGTGSDGGGTLNIIAGALQHNGVAVLTGQTVNPVAQGTLSGVATLDLALGTAAMYEIDLINMVPATDGVLGFLRFSQSGSFVSAAGSYAWGVTTNGAERSESDTEMQFGSTTVGNQPTEGITATVRIFRPSASSFVKTASWFGSLRAGNPVFLCTVGGGKLIANTDPIDGVRFLFSSGNIASGYYAMRSYNFT